MGGLFNGGRNEGWPPPPPLACVVTVQFDGPIGLKAAYPTHYTHSGIFGGTYRRGRRTFAGRGSLWRG